MGMIAETEIIDYHLSFADQGKQTSVFHFRLQPTNRSLPFPFSICSKQTEVAVFLQFRFPSECVCVFGGVWGWVCVCAHICIYMLLF
jgi:hypothetical protein